MRRRALETREERRERASERASEGRSELRERERRGLVVLCDNGMVADGSFTIYTTTTPTKATREGGFESEITRAVTCERGGMGMRRRRDLPRERASERAKATRRLREETRGAPVRRLTAYSTTSSQRRLSEIFVGFFLSHKQRRFERRV